MAAATQNILNTPELKFPNPPDKFGQDGNFYRCYDTLAQEIDEDMTKGLKEHLDTMLVFAGLFAGVNTAFLSLTVPLLSADPAEDTNALLAQNNILLIQLVMGRNDTTNSVDSILPSAAFSPPTKIFVINVLFLSSLAFAIVAAFLAVLGRQWLVYYRKRSGRSDLQRWEQLKRFLGAKRWRLEDLLDNAIPLLLQISLMIFCLSLVLYIRYLFPTSFVVVGIILCDGLAIFIGTALCTAWDKFCPFHSTLSRILVHGAHKVVKVVRFVVRSRIAFFDSRLWRRQEEGPESLQAIILQRALCVSDDPETLLHTVSNIITIRDPGIMNELWAKSAFQQRFLELYENPSDNVSRLVGYSGSPKELAESTGQLYRGAAAHILLTIRPDTRTSDALLSRHYLNLLLDIASFDASEFFMPSPPLGNPSSNLIRSNLGLFAVWCLFRGDDEAPVDAIGNHLVAYSEVLTRVSDYQLLSFFSWIVYWFAGPYPPHFESVQRIREVSRAIDQPPRSREGRIAKYITSSFRCLGRRVRATDSLSPSHEERKERFTDSLFRSLERLGEAYKGNVADVTRTVQAAFQALLRMESRDLLYCDGALTNMLQSIERILANEQNNPNAIVQHAFQLLKSCEEALRSPQLRTATRQIGEKLRVSATRLWRREYRARRAKNDPLDELMTTLGSYLTYLRSLKRTEFGYDEDVGVQRVFGAMLQPFAADLQLHDGGRAVCETFDAFVREVSEQIRKHSRRVRDPDEHWCHLEEEPSIVKGTRGDFAVNGGRETRDGPWFSLSPY